MVVAVVVVAIQLVPLLVVVVLVVVIHHLNKALMQFNPQDLVVVAVQEMVVIMKVVRDQAEPQLFAIKLVR